MLDPMLSAPNNFLGQLINSFKDQNGYDDYREEINTFEKCWFEIQLDFNVNFRTKAHILITHVTHVIEMTGKGVFLQLEEVVEATQRKIDGMCGRI